MSKLEVCNKALMLLGEPPVYSFDEQTSNSQRLDIAYKSGFLHLLSSHYFYFALTTSILVQKQATPLIGYGAVYEKPQGILYLKAIYDAKRCPVHFVPSAEGYNTKEPGQYYAEHTKEVAIEQTSHQFRTALSYYMAMEMCPDVSSSTTKYQLRAEEFKKVWEKCVSHDGIHSQIVVTLGEYPDVNYS